MTFKFHTLDDPNSPEVNQKGTAIEGVNNSGAIAGSYSTNTNSYGFYESGGIFTTLFGPAGSKAAYATGINDLGQIAGIYLNNFNTGVGFVYSNGAYTSLFDPNATFETVATGINNSGQVVGWYLGSNSTHHGFSYSGGANGTYTTIDVAGADATFARGINTIGEIVGSFDDNSGSHGFLDNNGAFTTLDDPLATSGTYAYGINDFGEIVGEYRDGTGNHGFLYSSGVYVTLDDPSTNTGTTAIGINNAGRIVGSYLDGSATNHGFVVVSGPRQADDFNGDPFSDVLWRNGNGALAEWQMNGPAITSSSISYQGNQVAPDASWSVTATNDFNGDGMADVLWRQDTGALSEWQMNGASIASSNTVTYQGGAIAPDASWSIAGGGDFGGDGKADLLWRQSSGSLAIWQMNGSLVASSGSVTYQNNALSPDASWSVAGIADFNGDAHADMLWRQSSGVLAVWQMNGSVVTQSNLVTYQGNALAPDGSWSVGGIGDFNDDGKADILWRQGSTGSLALWVMNGSTVGSSAAITYQGDTIAPDASWKIVEIGDFNGDGSSDILWRNSSGSMSEWLMNGSQIVASVTPSSQGNPVTPDSSWAVQARPTNFG